MIRPTLRRTLLFATLALLAGGPAAAKDYYFSDCGVSAAYISGPPGEGGPLSWAQSTQSACNHADHYACLQVATGGTRTNPYCLDPGNDGVRSSFAQLADGGAGTITDEFGPGDTIYLCAGPCDGQGAAIWSLQPSITYSGSHCNTANAKVFMSPRSSGTSGSPITIKPYCANGSCESITFTPDANMNGQWDSGEATSFMANGGAGGGSPYVNLGYWTIDGDPLNSGTPHISFTHWGNNSADPGHVGGLNSSAMFMFDCTDTTAGDPNNHDGIVDVFLNGIGVDHWGETAWSTDVLPGVGTNCFDDNDNGQDHGGYVFKVNDLGGTFSVTKSVFTTICGTIERLNNDPEAPAVMIFDHNTVTNCGAVTDPNDFNGPFPDLSHFYWTWNNITDCVGGLSTGNNISNVVMTDNIITVTGSRPLKYTGGASRAEFGISIDNGDTPLCDHCQTPGNINNAGNPVCVDNSPCTGGMVCPTCNPDHLYIARNQVKYLGGASATMDVGIRFSASRSDTIFTDAIVENNTVSGVKFVYSNQLWDGAALDIEPGSGITSTTGLKVRNNTIVAPTSGNARVLYANGAPFSFTNNICSGGVLQPYSYFTASAAASPTTNNDFYAASGTLVRMNSTDYTCAQVPTLQTGNICSKPSFAGEPDDLHLLGPQDCVDAGTDAPAVDFDGRNRPFGPLPDIGANELAGVDHSRNRRVFSAGG